MDISIADIARFSQAEVVVEPKDPLLRITHLTWDSRTVLPDSLFVAFAGEKADGNDYILEAVAAGAKAVIASRRPTPEDVAAARSAGAALFAVAPDGAIAAFQRLAGGYRSLLGARVAGITGSSGKTTTKDLVASVLATTWRTTATQGNYNNEIGVPATLLAAEPSMAAEPTEAMAVEMGMQALGEIAELCEAAKPHVGVITNVGVAHCELLGSRENIAIAKAELIEALPDGTGIAILNGDDPYTPFIREHAKVAERDIKVILYGLGAHNDIRAAHISYDAAGRADFDLWLPDGRPRRAHLALQGEHNVLNALAAAATGQAFGVAPERVLEALANARPAAMRQEVLDANGTTIINDTYNANPDSMRAALGLLARLPRDRMHIAVLGDMYELGSEEEAFHREIGAFAHINHVDLLVAVGKLGAHIAQGALDIGMRPEAVILSEAAEGTASLLAPYLSQHPIILVKASRGMHLEIVVQEAAELC
jgi:UDP-N-acetylmuramoyl-tripeptide--D-alanyl-D-alanine ligase